MGDTKSGAPPPVPKSLDVDAGALTFMSAFNDLNGIPASANEFTLNTSDLSFYNGKETLTEPGEIDVWIGPNSDEGLHGEFIVE